MSQKLSKIIAIAKDVYKSLGSGHSEVIYDKAMQVGLRLAGYKYENQKVVELTYKGHHVGEGYPDLVVHLKKEKIVLELKAVGSTMGLAEEQQIRNYMKIMGIKRGLLINFQQPGRKENGTEVEIKEINLDKAMTFAEMSDDELVLVAKDIIKDSGKISATLLQRKLYIGYARASQLMNVLRDKKIIQ